MARRTKEEFYCTECSKYFLTWLREDMTGNYTFECPNCNHHHYRFIKEGLITTDRHSQTKGEVEIVMGLKATIRDTPWHTEPDFRRSCLFAIEGGVRT